jgi:hypothetical protein
MPLVFLLFSFCFFLYFYAFDYGLYSAVHSEKADAFLFVFFIF